MRIYLDFVSDESYTPTKIQFLAGMGVHDLLEFAEMSFEQPTGWIDVDFSKIGDHQLVGGGGGGDGEWRQPAAPVLRAFLVQVRILENHQNGKDTHLRAVQLFARDDAQPTKRAAPAKAAAATQPRKKYNTASNNITIADWMMDPDIR
jgi:anaphase-promoting complex subunit 10